MSSTARAGTFEPTSAAFDEVFAAIAQSPTLRAIHAHVHGDAAQYSFTSRAEIHRIAERLRVGAGRTFLDLACGLGGPGLEVARVTGASLLGLDWSAVAVESARALAASERLEERARFVVADAAATDLPPRSLDACVSIDALQLLPDRGAAMREVARVLRPGARFVFTTWEGAPGRGFPARFCVDNAALLRAAGFRIDEREEQPEWTRHARALFSAVLARRDAIATECGEASSAFFEEAERVLATREAPPRVLYVATLEA